MLPAVNSRSWHYSGLHACLQSFSVREGILLAMHQDSTVALGVMLMF